MEGKQKGLFFEILGMFSGFLCFPKILRKLSLGGNLEWSRDEGDPGMVEFTGSGENRLKTGTAADSYWAMFVDDNTDLIRDYYQKATNEWAAERKKLAFEDGKHGSWWMR